MATLGHRRLVRSCRYPRLTWRYARWRYIDNLSPLLAYRCGRRLHSNRRSHELAKLNQDGVVITSAQALLGSDSYFEELTSQWASSSGTMRTQLPAHVLPLMPWRELA